MVQALLATPGIDTTITNIDGQTALDIATNEEIRAIIQFHIAALPAVGGAGAATK